MSRLVQKGKEEDKEDQPAAAHSMPTLLVDQLQATRSRTPATQLCSPHLYDSFTAMLSGCAESCTGLNTPKLHTGVPVSEGVCDDLWDCL